MNDHHNMPHHMVDLSGSSSAYTWRSFIPLIAIFTVVLIMTMAGQFAHGLNIHNAMLDFMASFFLVFGVFKVINIKNFAQAYRAYDLIAKQTIVYGYVYPFLELGLSFLYFMRWFINFANVFTLILMSISALGVFLELRKKKTITCACLGMVFKVPMTYVTLLEDLLMAGMAAVMLLR